MRNLNSRCRFRTEDREYHYCSYRIHRVKSRVLKCHTAPQRASTKIFNPRPKILQIGNQRHVLAKNISIQCCIFNRAPILELISTPPFILSSNDRDPDISRQNTKPTSKYPTQTPHRISRSLQQKHAANSGSKRNCQARNHFVPIVDIEAA
jgi:hypothetical protein